jgi:hypothetical protein
MAAGSVVVNLIANTTGFKRKMTAAQKTMRVFRNTAADIARNVARIGTVAAAAAAGGLTLLTRRSFQNIDAIAKMSDRLGV